MKYSVKFLKYISLLVVAIALFSCNFESMKKVSEDRFFGVWELKGRSMLEGIKVSIKKNENGVLVGNVVEINENKYVKLFLEPGEKFISKIKRSSNFEFKITEKKIGGQLFSTYGLKTSKEYKVVFIDEDTIDFGSGVFYKRVK